LLDPQRRRHPYLFEHHPRNSVRTFLKTLVAGLMPRRFWKSMHPAQAIHLRRLSAYWALTTMMTTILALAALWTSEYSDIRKQFTSDRNHILSFAIKNPNHPYIAKVIQSYGTIQAYLDDEYPNPTLVNQFMMTARSAFNSRIGRNYVFHWLQVYLVWPFASILGLMIFRWTMRRVKVKSIHVFRCVVYSLDAWVWYALFSFALVFSRGALSLVANPRPWLIPALFAGAAVLCFLHTVYRLILAYRKYLRFDRPAATVLCAQFVSGLLVLTVLSLYSEWQLGHFKVNLW
jgi:hypothetical protein